MDSVLSRNLRIVDNFVDFSAMSLDLVGSFTRCSASRARD